MTEITHGMDVPEGTEMPEGFELGDGVRRERHCVENWPEADSVDYDPRCCRFPKSCSATSVRNRVYREGILEPPSTRKITAGTGLSYGNQPHGSAGFRLSDEVLEIQRIWKRYVDTEQFLALRSWQAANPDAELDTAMVVQWQMDGMEKWATEFPQLTALLQEATP